MHGMDELVSMSDAEKLAIWGPMVICGWFGPNNELRWATKHEDGCGHEGRMGMMFRCTQCGSWFHRPCAERHFANHGDRAAGVVLELERVREIARLLGRDLVSDGYRVDGPTMRLVGQIERICGEVGK